MALPLAACLPDGPPRRPERSRVLVVGAGLAGLAAAWELSREGCDVQVLEAMERPGGRVLTLRAGFADGLYAEAGAVSVPDNHPLTVGYCREFGLLLDPSDTRTTPVLAEYFIGGRRVHDAGGGAEWPLASRPEERALDVGGLRHAYLDETADSLGDPAAPGWPSPAARRLDEVTFAAFLRGQGASEAAVRRLSLGYFEEWGDGPATCSALSMLRDAALNRALRTSFVVRGGTDRLPHAFAAALEPRVLYGAVVVRMQQSRSGVEVTYQHAGALRTTRADRVVCAIPFSVLRGIEVSPPLSASKRETVARLRHTSVTRVYLQVRERFWTGPASQVPTDLPIMIARDATAGQAGSRGILEAFVAGPRARMLSSMEKRERIRFALAHMDRVFPGAARHFEAGTGVCWDHEPWARGDYAWFGPGQLTAWLPHLGSVEGRIHFAGDQTSPWPGWMQGALASGVRTAAEILSA